MDNLPFLTRLMRYANTSSTLAKTAGSLATSHLLNTQGDDAFQAQKLKEALGKMKGPVMKIAQFLATVPGALPQAYSEAFLTLQTNAPPMGRHFVSKRMACELGEDWLSHFQSFDIQPAFSASLGQVHHAVLHSGEHVACKLQYPDMEAIIDADLNQLKLILSLYHLWSGAIQTDNIFAEIKEKLFEELDYEKEAINTQTYGNFFQDHPEIHIPKIFSDHSTSKLLVQSWSEGKSVLSFADHPLEERNHIGKLLFYGWYWPLYCYGALHGDPHPGNYHITPEGHLTLLDFGCVRYFSDDFIQGVRHLYEGLRDHNEEKMIQGYEEWGFSHLSKEIIEVMGQWARLLFDPLLDDRVRPIQEQITGWDVASSIHEKLHKLGGIRPPREFVFMDRAAVGIGSVLFHLKCEMNWHRLFEDILDKSRSSENK